MGRLRRVIRQVARFGSEYRLWQKALVPVVFLLLGMARAVVLICPFRWYKPWLGPVDRQVGRASPAPQDQDTVLRVGRVVQAVAKRTPWTSNCLPQALVAAWLLRQMGVPHAVHLGLRRASDTPDRGLEAHAWVLSGTVPVTGVKEAVGMTPVATFVSA